MYKRQGQGRENIKVYLKEHAQIADEIEKKLLDTLKNEGEPVKEPEPEVTDDEFSEIMDMIIDEAVSYTHLYF